MLKPRLVVSACLNSEPTRYDGKIINYPLLSKLRKFCEIISVCPEVSIGFSVPREKIILYKDINSIRVIQLTTEKDFTEELLNFSKNFLNNLSSVEGFLLKSKSPSCGVSFKTKVYEDKKGEKLIGYEQGIFAKEALKKFPLLPIVDEEILKDKNNLENFLIRIFTLRRFEEFKNKAKNIEDVIDFYRKAYLLLRSYNPFKTAEIENLLYQENLELNSFLEIWEKPLKEILATPIEKQNQIKILIYVIETYLKSSEKKKEAFKLAKKYEKGEIPLIEVLTFIKNILAQSDKKILCESFYFEPYPQELKELFYLHHLGV